MWVQRESISRAILASYDRVTSLVRKDPILRCCIKRSKIFKIMALEGNGEHEYRT